LGKGTLAREIYNRAEEISERHRHRYEFNPEFRETLERAGLVISGESPDGKFVEIAELPREAHPWFLGCQFHPEYKSKPLQAHPLFASFVRAAYENRMRNETSLEKLDTPETVLHERAGVAGDD
jgi:CTP synthase